MSSSTTTMLFYLLVLSPFLMERGASFTLSMTTNRGGGSGRRDRITNPYERWVRQMKKDKGFYPLGGEGREYSNTTTDRDIDRDISTRFFPLSRTYHNTYLQRKGGGNEDEDGEEGEEEEPFLHIKIYKPVEREGEDEEEKNEPTRNNPFFLGSSMGRSRCGGADENRKKSEHFEVVESGACSTSFKNVGGYNTIKRELEQCIDILTNYTKYARFNVRVPKGLLLEGPPGNGKTLLAKALSGEAKTAFIAVSGAEFQEKYVGVGAGKIRELFQLAMENRPCIIFIDEIDALGKKRSGDGEGSSSERDNTLNELLVAMDGFKNTSGIFIIGATNRADMLDPALLRPGRMDKKIFIGNPDTDTRRAILEIHREGKPFSTAVVVEDLVYTTEGLSGAQIENLLNEAMLNALKEGGEEIGRDDIDTVMNKIWGGWQPNEHAFSADMMERIAIHEMGHAIVGIFCKYHAKVVKVVISLSSPSTPGYTIFESPVSKLHLREGLFEKLAVLLAGRIAEEMIYDLSITTGAVNDFQQVVETAEKMVRYYGMGKELIYPVNSEKYKEKVDMEINELIQDAYFYAKMILEKYRYMIEKGAGVLLKEKVLTYEGLVGLVEVEKEECKEKSMG